MVYGCGAKTISKQTQTVTIPGDVVLRRILRIAWRFRKSIETSLKKTQAIQSTPFQHDNFPPCNEKRENGTFEQE